MPVHLPVETAAPLRVRPHTRTFNHGAALGSADSSHRVCGDGPREPTRDGPELASSGQLACFPRTCAERVWTRCEPVRARSRAGCRITQWLDGLDPVEQNGLGLRDPQQPNLCQPYCQPFRVLLGIL